MYRVDDTRIAHNSADLWDGSIEVNLNVGADGNTSSNTVFATAGGLLYAISEALTSIQGDCGFVRKSALHSAEVISGYDEVVSVGDEVLDAKCHNSRVVDVDQIRV